MLRAEIPQECISGPSQVLRVLRELGVTRKKFKILWLGLGNHGEVSNKEKHAWEQCFMGTDTEVME